MGSALDKCTTGTGLSEKGDSSRQGGQFQFLPDVWLHHQPLEFLPSLNKALLLEGESLGLDELTHEHLLKKFRACITPINWDVLQMKEKEFTDFAVDQLRIGASRDRLKKVFKVFSDGDELLTFRSWRSAVCLMDEGTPTDLRTPLGCLRLSLIFMTYSDGNRLMSEEQRLAMFLDLQRAGGKDQRAVAERIRADLSHNHVSTSEFSVNAFWYYTQRGWISGHDRLLSLKSQIRTPKIIPLCPLPLPLPPTALPLLPPPQHPPGPPRGALPPGPSPCSQGPSPSSWQMTQSQPVGEEEGDRNNDRPTGVPSDHHHVNMKDSGEGDGAGGGDGGLPLPLSAETGLQQASVPPPSQGNQSAPPPWMPPATSGPSPTPCTSSGMPGPSTSSDSSASQQPPPPPGQTPRNKRLAYLKGTGARPHPNNTGDLPPLRTPRQGQTGPRGGPGTLAFGRPPMPGPTGPPGPLMMHPRPDAHSAGVLYPPTAHPLPVGMQPDARMPPDLIFPGHMLVNGQDCVPPPIQDGSHEPSIEEETDGDGLRQGERRRQEKETAVVGRRPGGDGAGGTTATPGTRSGSSTAEGEEELEGPAKGDGKGSAKALQAAGGAKGKRRGRVDSKEGVAGMGERGKVGGGLRGCCGRAAIASLHD